MIFCEYFNIFGKKNCKASLRRCNSVWDVQVDVSLSNMPKINYECH